MNRLFERLLRKPYRDAYVSENARTGIAYQIRALRMQRGWSQMELARRMRKPQSVVSRLEDPDYGKPSVNTLLEVAAAFDIALLIKYVSFPEFLRRTRDVSQQAMEADSFDEKQLRAISFQKGATVDINVGSPPAAAPQIVTPYDYLPLEVAVH